MNPVYGEYIKFLKDNGLKEYELKEGYYWYDKSIIKAFDKEGNIYKILRICIDDNLNITFKRYENKKFEIASWLEIAEINKERIDKQEKYSLKLIKESYRIYNHYSKRKVATLTSSGKDSTLTAHLVKKAIGEDFLIFNNTSLDCADTYLYIKQLDNVQIINPKEGFYQWRDRLNFIPTRFARACCSIFKEGAMVEVLDEKDEYLFFMGMRNQESSTRSNYIDTWKNEKWGNRKWNAILPIRKWSELDVWLYIIREGIDINPKYKKGYSRCGCAICCAYATKTTWVLDKYWYSLAYERWHNILDKDFIENKKAPIMNCSNKEYHIYWNGGSVRDEATEDIIKEFAEQQNLDIEIAKKYFDKKCMCCDKKLKKDDIALSMKYYGRYIEKFKCINCLAKDLGVKTKDLKEKIKDFKNQGCDLF